jgi:UDP-N-acetylglucosamine 4-epimerase
VPRFTMAVLEGRQPLVNGTGDISRDFTYVDNVVSANMLAAKPTVRTGLTCNIACGDQHDLLELLAAIAREAGRTADPIFGPARPGDIKDSLADISLAREALGYEVKVPFEAGIAKTVAWYRDQAADAADAAGSRSGSTPDTR